MNKPKYHRHSCPNCGKPVEWTRLHLKPWISAVWQCKNCNTSLSFSKIRRIVIGCCFGIVFVLAYLIIENTKVNHPIVYLPLGVLFYLGASFVFSFDKIKINKIREPEDALNSDTATAESE